MARIGNFVEAQSPSPRTRHRQPHHTPAGMQVPHRVGVRVLVRVRVRRKGDHTSRGRSAPRVAELDGSRSELAFLVASPA